MKKALLKILSLVLIACMLFTAAACSNGSWEGTTMKNWGAVKEMGGFVAETDNYFYVINGVGASTADNVFGTPVKGALVAVDKKDLSKSEIVVPKLFVASDYNAGLFIDGDYVYYGTPSTDKLADGTPANTELHFMRTKLDGTDTKEYFKLSGISSEYRFVKGGNTVYIVYYDATETQLVAYDTANASKTVIAKTDAETDKDYSLAKYNFVKDATGDVVVYYTTTVYAEKYLANKVDTGNYTRATESYNNLYAYKAGDAVNAETGLAGTLIGSATGYTYEIKTAGEFTFYTETSVKSTTDVKTYGDTTKNVIANKKGVEIKNDAYVADGNIIKSLTEVYSLAENKVYRSTLVGNDKLEKQLVASKTSIASIIAVENGTLYYTNSESKILRTALTEGADEVILSQGTLLTSWFKTEIHGDKLFYLDNSSTGVSYVKCIDLSATVIEEDSDEDGKNDKFYLDSEVLVGVMTDSDKASVVASQINAIDGTKVLDYVEKDGALTVTAVTDARAAYDALSEEVKKSFNETALDNLKNFEKAIEMANVYAKLDGMYGYVNKTAEEQQALKDTYFEIKDVIKKFEESENYSVVSKMIDNNALWSFQQAEKQFEADK